MAGISRIDGLGVPPIHEFEPMAVSPKPQAWSHVKDLQQRSQAQVKDTSTRPVLTPPNLIASKEKSVVPEPPEFKDMEALVTYLLNSQRRNIEEKGVVDGQLLQGNLQTGRALHKEKLKKLDEAGSKAKYSTILGWARAVINGALIAGGLVSVGLLFFSVPAALPPMLVAAQAFANVSQGVVAGVEGMLKYQQNAIQGEVEIIKVKQHIENSHVQKALRELEASQEAIVKNWGELRAILDKLEEANRSLLR
jgi:hypothetical protein